jgi:flagellar motility protein MotE (MotC chaperone)
MCLYYNLRRLEKKIEARKKKLMEERKGVFEESIAPTSIVGDGT